MSGTGAADSDSDLHLIVDLKVNGLMKVIIENIQLAQGHTVTHMELDDSLTIGWQNCTAQDAQPTSTNATKKLMFLLD